MRNFLNFPTLYLFLLIVHTILGYYYVPSIVLRMVYIPRYLLEFWFVFNGIKYISSSKYMKALTVLALMFLMYGFLLLVSGVDSTWKIQGNWDILFIKDYVGSLIPIFVFYYLGVTNQINEDWFEKICFLFIISAVIEYNRTATDIALNSIIGQSNSFVNNTGYIILSILPSLMFLEKRPVLQYIVIALTLVMVVLSYKRGAIIACVIAVAFFLYIKIKNKESRGKGFIIVLSFVAIVIGARYFRFILENDIILVDRFAMAIEGEDSGRSSIYSSIIDYLIFDNNPFTLFFGNGAYATCKYFGKMAHNDWLEITMDIGLLGLILYVRYWIILCVTVKRSKMLGLTAISNAIIIFIIIYFISSCFSMSISAITIYSGSVIGFCEGRLSYLQNKIYNKEN